MCVVLCCCGAQAQQAETTIRSRAELVLVPTVIHDHAGAHIPNLKKEDFSIQENGVEQKIAVWEEVRTSNAVAQRVASRPNTFTNALAQSTTPHRLTVVALDFINTPILDQGRARDEMLKFLESWASEGEPLMLVVLTRSGVRVIQDYTTDPKVLAVALYNARIRHEQVPGAASLEQQRSETESDPTMKALLQAAEEADKTSDAWQQVVAIRQTLEAMQQIARALAGVPGRKSLIWASAGFPFSVTDTFMSLDPNIVGRSSIFDVEELYHRTWQVLNDAQISVYPVDVGGLTNTLGMPASMSAPTGGRNPAAFHQQAIWNQNDRFSTFQVVAQATGGRAFLNTNDLAGAFRKAAEDSSSYYMLGYYRSARDTKPGWRRLKVTVRHPGAEVRARNGFFVEKANVTEKESKREISMAMTSPLDATSLVFQVRWMPVKGGGKKKQVPYELNIPFGMLTVDEADDNHVLFDLEVLAKTTAGVAAQTGGQTMDAHLKPESLAKLREGGLHYEQSIDLPPGEYTVRFLVRDGLSGRMGTVTAPIKVE
jgi:VWFA-related protein